jgi:hypothetical protein
MTVSVRPGRYATAICEGPTGHRDQTPWCRLDRDHWTYFFREMIEARRARGFKVLYVIRATVPERPNAVDNVTSRERVTGTCVTVTASESQKTLMK